MLQTITWKDYSITVGLLTGLYYGWWLIRYYPGWPKPTSLASEGKTTQRDEPAVGVAEPRETQKVEQTQLPQQFVQVEPPQPAQPRVQPPAQAEQPQPEAPQPELPFPGEPAHTAFLATIEANCKNDVLRIVEKASMAGVAEAELLELLHGVLTADPYPTLKGTIHRENVDALVGRELERYGSIRPAPEVIRKLWEVEG